MIGFGLLLATTSRELAVAFIGDPPTRARPRGRWVIGVFQGSGEFLAWAYAPVIGRYAYVGRGTGPHLRMRERTRWEADPALEIWDCEVLTLAVWALYIGPTIRHWLVVRWVAHLIPVADHVWLPQHPV